MTGADVSPLTEIRLAENDGAGRAQLARNERIFGRPGANQGQRSRSGHHLVRGIDVVFDKYGNAVQRTTRTLGFAFLVKGIGDGERVRIEFDHAVEGGTMFVDLV